MSSVRRGISSSPNALSRLVHDPAEDDLSRGYRLLRYLVGTQNECIYLKPREVNILGIESFTEADLAGCIAPRNPTSGAGGAFL